MNYTKSQLIEMVNELDMTNENALKFVLKKMIGIIPENMSKSPLRVGNLVIFKATGNNDQSVAQANDMVTGYFDQDFITAIYLGGDLSDLNNFRITQKIN